MLDEIFGLFGLNGKAGTKADDATKDAKEWVIDTLKAACSGGNVKKEDVVGLYDVGSPIHLGRILDFL